jgi:hypothetical protein
MELKVISLESIDAFFEKMEKEEKLPSPPAMALYFGLESVRDLFEASYTSGYEKGEEIEQKFAARYALLRMEAALVQALCVPAQREGAKLLLHCFFGYDQMADKVKGWADTFKTLRDLDILLEVDEEI